MRHRASLTAATDTPTVNTQTPLRCTLGALLAAWVTMVFGSSTLLAVAGLGGPAHVAGGSQVSIARAVWEVADNVGPAGKIQLILVFAVLTIAVRAWRSDREMLIQFGVHAALGAAAMCVTLATIPAGLSRGFGLGLTGTRLDPVTLPYYLLSGVAGGVAYMLAERRCLTRATARWPTSTP
jgi:hypothetical protein